MLLVFFIDSSFLGFDYGTVTDSGVGFPFFGILGFDSRIPGLLYVLIFC